MPNESCPCKREKCPRHGNCEACREHHRTNKVLAACDKVKDRAEKELQRSIKKQK